MDGQVRMRGGQHPQGRNAEEEPRSGLRPARRDYAGRPPLSPRYGSERLEKRANNGSRG